MKWWMGLAPVEAPGPGDASAHRLVWRGGELNLSDHGDPEAERALGALGGDRCGCLDLFDAWHAQHDDGGILTVAARTSAEELTVPTRPVRQVVSEVSRWRGHLAALRVEARGRGDYGALARLDALAGPTERTAARRIGFLHLLGLPPSMQHRLQASVAAALAAAALTSRDQPKPDQLARLTVATAARVVPALRGLGWSGTMADVELVTQPLDRRHGEATIGPTHAVLPVEWLSQVWGRGLGTIGGGLVVAVNTVLDDGAALEVIVCAPGKPQVALRVEGWENAWRTT